MPDSVLQLLDTAASADPYPGYHAQRAADPVHWDTSITGGAWVLTRYADVFAALRDPRLSGDRMPLFRLVFRDTDEARAFDDSMARWLLNLEPPRHTGLRALVSKAFAPRLVEALRPRIEAITRELLDAAVAAHPGHLDVIGELAYPLPVTVITELLGLPREDREPMRRWAADIGQFFGAMKGIKRAMASDAEFRAHLRNVIAERRQRPGNDFLSALLAAEDQGEKLDEADIVSTIILLFIAGHETTTHLIGNGLLALLRNPNQLALLAADPSLAPSAIEELLRYDGTAQFVSRIAREDVDIGGKRIPAGSVVVLSLGAANRDPAQFPDPDRLDIRRTENRHVSFGMGIHYCLGAPLARIEGAIALNTLLARWPRLRLATTELTWQNNVGFRGLRALPLLLE